MHKPFIELKKIWYEKLKESGFEDAENTDDPSEPLKVWHSHWFKDPEKIEANSIYYSKASEIVHTYAFDNSTHRKIWELHSIGLSKRKIEKMISADTPTYKREQIGNIINFIASSIL